MKKRILIIGGSKGIGLAIAKEAKTQNNEVFVLSRTTNSDLKQLQVNCITQDFTNEALIDKTLIETNPNILIICAAKGIYGEIKSIDFASVKSCCISTFISPILWMSRALFLLPKNSTICYISSLLAKLPNLEWVFYGASKAGVEYYIRSIEPMASNLQKNLCVIYPGCVKTDFHTDSGTSTPEVAVSPDIISKEILSAIINKKNIWVAPMDFTCINDFNKKLNNLQKKYGNTIK